MFEKAKDVFGRAVGASNLLSSNCDAGGKILKGDGLRRSNKTAV